MAGLIHLNSFLRLCWDERRVQLATQDDEQLWRLVYRRSGMGRLEFKQAQDLGRQEALLVLHSREYPAGSHAEYSLTYSILFNMTRWRRYKAGEVIFDTEAGGSGLVSSSQTCLKCLETSVEVGTFFTGSGLRCDTLLLERKNCTQMLLRLTLPN